MGGKVVNFDMTLNRDNGIYQPGDLLAGTVHIRTREDTPINGVYVWILGQADVSWPEKQGGKKTNFDYEIYMKECITLWGKEFGQPKKEVALLPTGTHEYSFEYKLPRNLPSTFEAQEQCKGRVHYVVRGKLDSPEEPSRRSRDKTLILLSVSDLNKFPRVAESVQVRRQKAIGCCCCQCGSVSSILRLDRTGFVPGEDINVDAEIQNLSRKEVAASYVTLQQMVRLHAQGNSKTSTCDIFRISGGKIRPGDSAFYHDIIHIPPLPPSRLDGCGLIDIEYVLTVGLLPSGSTHPVEVSIIITVGTIPFSHILPAGVKVTPAYSRYCHTSGEIEDYGMNEYSVGKIQHVYTYYKAFYKRTEANEGGEANLITI